MDNLSFFLLNVTITRPPFFLLGFLCVSPTACEDGFSLSLCLGFGRVHFTRCHPLIATLYFSYWHNLRILTNYYNIESCAYIKNKRLTLSEDKCQSVHCCLSITKVGIIFETTKQLKELFLKKSWRKRKHLRHETY